MSFSHHAVSTAVNFAVKSNNPVSAAGRMARCFLLVSMLGAVVSCAPAKIDGFQPLQELAEPSLAISKDIDLIRLQGVLASAQEVESVRKQAADTFGAEMIINDLQVDQGMAGANWLPGVMQTAEHMQGVADFSLVAGAGQLIVGGAVDSKNTADQFAEIASDAAGMQLAVSSSFTYPIEDQTASLVGAELIEAAQTSFRDSLAEGVIPDIVVEQPAVAMSQAEFPVAPSIALVRTDAQSQSGLQSTLLDTTSADSDGDGVPDSLDECQSRPGYPVNEGGCAMLGGYLESVRFYASTDQLTEIAKNSLDGIAGVMQDHPVSKIAVLSYGKASGNEEESRVQARRRAFSVIEYLVSQGIEKNRLSAFALGGRDGVRDQIMIKEID